MERARHRAVRRHGAREEPLRRDLRQRHQVLPPEDPPRRAQAPEHEPVEPHQHLVVEAGRGALLPPLEQQGPHLREPGLHRLQVDAVLLGQRGRVLHHREHRQPVFEVPRARHAEVLGRERSVVLQHLVKLRPAPGEEAALVPLGVGVLRGGEGALPRAQLAHQPRRRLIDDLPPQRPRGHLLRGRVDREELRVVVQHLLEVRHGPALVDGVAVKAAAQVIEDPACRHLLQREQGRVAHRAPRPTAGSRAASARAASGSGTWGPGARTRRSGDRCGAPKGGPPPRGPGAGSGRDSAASSPIAITCASAWVSSSPCASRALRSRLPGLGDAHQQLLERRQPVPRLAGEVGAAVERARAGVRNTVSGQPPPRPNSCTTPW